MPALPESRLARRVSSLREAPLDVPTRERLAQALLDWFTAGWSAAPMPLAGCFRTLAADCYPGTGETPVFGGAMLPLPAAAGLGRGLELNTLNKRRSFERAASQLRPDILSNRIAERRQQLSERMTRAERTIERMLDRSRARIERADAVFATLPSRLEAQTGRARDRLGNFVRQADTAIRHQLTRARSELVAQERILQSLSYKNVLKRGYAVVRDEDDRPVSLAAALSTGAAISIEFADGRIGAVTGDDGNVPPSSTPASGASPSKKRAVKPAETAAPPKQGSLF